ncbi:ImmA/IrrE family metallo-endopeptidase [Thermaerobacillus caldiproteolyticus]|uniref:Zn-dependent peptidase ImmA (M78 family) n=1 Tax=Thermaerobacillus caldiproteolyticus TaxID=247480 RepID=A0A7W0C181_9BACL|nr:ImmA/IrrE family metallo-endopeptidase [Anoxybacillus caldiproteolyticus]MBA2876909.1 Zn-dependent peptidase ImmA (M78 family) [Anoxybacillus caldiproteolyticus]
MTIENITFNPYDESNTNDVLNKIEQYLNKTPPETVLQELSRKIFFDYSVGWREPLIEVFKKYDELTRKIPGYYYELVQAQHNEILPQYTYLITFLIAEKILPTDIISKEIVNNLKNEEAKYILMAFLTSWDTEKALELDAPYVKKNFEHIIHSKLVQIEELILSAAKEDSYYNAVVDMLSDETIQYHFYQEIQKMIKKRNSKHLKELEIFIDKCTKSHQEHIIEFISDLLELSTVRNFLNERWGFNLMERLYRNFASNAKAMSNNAKRMSLNALNRFKRKQKSSFAVAARYQIDKLRENDKNYIVNSVEKVASAEITDYNDILVPPTHPQWEWKDYAYFLVKTYKEKHPDQEVVDVIQLAKDLGIEIFMSRLETENFDACLVRDVTLKMPVIIVNRHKKSKGRINFSIAHEIAHAVLPHHAQSSFFCFLEDVTEMNKFKMDKQLEIEANNFAAYILLPDEQFKKDIAHLDFTIKNVAKLSKKYGASLVLVSKKWVELSNLDIAMVFSTNGIVDWWCKSESFPYYRIESAVESASSVLKAAINEERKSIRKKVIFSQWFKDESPRYIIQEESYKIFDDKVLTLLQIIEEE